MAVDINTLFQTRQTVGYTGSQGSFSQTQSGSNSTSSATDITLTNSSNLFQLITMTATAKFVNLPDATTLTANTNSCFIIKNTGSLVFGVKDGGGNFLAALEGGDVLIFWNGSKATAAGTWVVGNQTRNRAISKIFKYDATQYLAYDTYSQSATQLTTNKVILSYIKASDSKVYSVVLTLSGTTISTGTAVAVSSNTSYNTSIVTLSATKALATWDTSDGVSHKKAVVLDISGTTITVNTIVDLDSFTSSTNNSIFCLIALSSTQALYAFVDNSFEGYVETVNISGSTITLGTAVAFSSFASPVTVFTSTSMCMLTSTKAFASLGSNYSGGALVNVIFSVSGTTVTAGTTSLLYYNKYNIESPPVTIALSSTKVFLVYDVVFYTNLLMGVVVNISGTSIASYGAIKPIVPKFNSYILSTYYMLPKTGYYLGNNRVVLSIMTKPFFDFYLVTYTINDNSIIEEKETYIENTNYTLTMGLAPFGSGKYVVAYEQINSNSYANLLEIV